MIVGLVIGLLQGFSLLKKQAEEVNQAALSAKASENNVVRMRNLKLRLEELKDVEASATKMTSPQDSYQYQERSINTLTEYARQAGVAISQISFSPKTKGIDTAGSNNVIILVALQNPVPYASFLKFMRLVESGLSQMQILQVQISQDKDGLVAVGPMSIAIYVK